MVGSNLTLSVLLQEFCDQSGPAALVTGSQPRSVVAVEVFMEQDQVTPVWILLVERIQAVYCPSVIGHPQKDASQPFRQTGRDAPESFVNAGARRALDRELVAVIVMEFL